MKNWTAFLFVGLFVLVGCFNTDEDPSPIGSSIDPPVWLDNVEIVTADTTPAAQVDLFVAANAMDTVVTSSGLVYFILEPGEMAKPTATSNIVVWYRGYKTDGMIFDESRVTPFSAPLNQLIQGWQEAIPLIGKGGKMWILLKPELAYGDDPPGAPITETSVLVFEIELIDF